jgi:hypothetical protein
MVLMWVGLSYAAMPFLLLKTRRWWQCYVSLYFHVHILLFSYPLLKPYVKRWLGVRSAKEDQVQLNGSGNGDSRAANETKKLASNGLDKKSNGVHLTSGSENDQKKLD